MLEFLGVDPNLRPDFAVHNESKRARSGTLQRLIYNPPGPVRGAARALRRYPVVHRARDVVLGMNSRAEGRPPMDPRLRAELLDEFAPEIERLSTVINRDLSAWHN